MAGLHVPDAVGIVGTRPALGVVPGVTQRVKEFLVSGWGDIERFARGQLDARGDLCDVNYFGRLATIKMAGWVG